MRHYFILNPAAGKGAALRLIPAIREAFQGEDFILHQSTAPGEATEYVRGECRLHQGEALRFYASAGTAPPTRWPGGCWGRKTPPWGWCPAAPATTW